MAGIVYRVAQVSDAGQMVAFYNRVAGETTYLSFGQDEYPLDEELQEKRLIEVSMQKNSTILLALAAETIAGIATITSSQKKRLRHEGEFGIVVEKAFWGQGIGSEMFSRLVRFSENNGITTRLSLVTRTDNEKAVEWYKRMGFEIEGCLRNSTIIDGACYNTYVMAKILKKWRGTI